MINAIANKPEASILKGLGTLVGLVVAVSLGASLSGCGTMTPEMLEQMNQSNAAFMQQMNTTNQVIQRGYSAAAANRTQSTVSGSTGNYTTGDPCGGGPVLSNGRCR